MANKPPDQLLPIPPLPPDASPHLIAVHAEAVQRRAAQLEALDFLAPARHGPEPGFDVDYPEAQAKIDTVVQGRPFLLWIEGHLRVGTAPYELHDPEADGATIRDRVDQLETLARDLGLVVHRDYGPAAENPTVSARRRWSTRRVNTEDALAVLLLHAGVARDTLAELLFREGDTPWTNPLETAARGKTNVLIHRLAKMNRIVKRYDRSGTLRLYPTQLDPLGQPMPGIPAVATRLARRPSGISALDETPPPSPTREGLDKATAYLQERLGPMWPSADTATWRDYAAEMVRRAFAVDIDVVDAV
jgi:hypothetical protein